MDPGTGSHNVGARVAYFAVASESMWSMETRRGDGDGKAAVFGLATPASVVEAPVGRGGAARDLRVRAWWDRWLS